MTDPATNPRFTDVGGGLSSELIANQVQLFYDPANNSARAIFNAMPYLQLGSTYQALGTQSDMLSVDFSSRMTDCLGIGTDPVTGADLTQLSVAGFMLVLKAAYNTFVQERADSIAAGIAAAEAARLAAEAAAAPPVTEPAP